LFAARIAELRELLIRENRKHNLTRITGPEEFWIKHVFDSLLAAEAFPAIFADGAEVADLGCGAGFPSLVLAAAFPEIHITAMDSRGKKTDFVSLASERLELENIRVVQGRGRELARREEFKNRFDLVVARAVSDALAVHREVRGMLTDESDLILYKSPETAVDELRGVRAAKSADDLEWSVSGVFSLPNDMGKRVFLRGSKRM
jgi:16S rRNA (guanine527-N7)-methyltransferase